MSTEVAPSTSGHTSAGGPPVISANGVSKRFSLHKRKATSLKERFIRRERATLERELWALKDVNLQVGKGETVGLIGHNGSGKSTLLKVISGILKPNEGTAHIEGRIASLLELGAGFNTELSGRDNVYLNASLLGLTRHETDNLFDQIVDFSELADRIDDPVKNYSSGMYVKLGFAVAVHVDPDVLLVDEVLSVGDEAFQEKCIATIERFQSEGRTILFVSHALGLVEKLCNRAIVLDHGVVQFDGEPSKAVGILRGLLGTAPAETITHYEHDAGGGTPHASISSVTLSGEIGGAPQTVFGHGQLLSIRVEVETLTTEGGDVTCVIMGHGDFPVAVMRTDAQGGLRHSASRQHVDFTISTLPPMMGPFSIAVGVELLGRVVVATRYDDCFQAPGDTADGLIDVAYDVAVLPSDA